MGSLYGKFTYDLLWNKTKSGLHITTLKPIVNRIFSLILLLLLSAVAMTIEEAFGQIIRELRNAKKLSLSRGRVEIR